MLSRTCTEALSIQANVTISGSIAKLIRNNIAPLPFPLPAPLLQYWYIKRGERVRGHAQFYATLELTCISHCRWVARATGRHRPDGEVASRWVQPHAVRK